MSFISEASFPQSARFVSLKPASSAGHGPEISQALPASASREPDFNSGPRNSGKSGTEKPQKSIYMASDSCSVAYLPFPPAPGRAKHESTDVVYRKLQRFFISDSNAPAAGKKEVATGSGSAVSPALPSALNADSGHSLGSLEAVSQPLDVSLENGQSTAETGFKIPQSVQKHVKNDNSAPKIEQEPREIPFFELDKLDYKDPISLVEALAEEGREFGAIKIKMPEAFINDKKCRLNPDSFTFKANRLHNNPRENELILRLRFHNELMKLHTSGVPDHSASGTITPQPEGSIKMESVSARGLDSLKVSEFPTTLDEQSDFVKTETDSLLPTEEGRNPENEQKSSENEQKSLENEQGKPSTSRTKLPSWLTKIPMIDKRPLDLFEFFRCVLRKGGCEEVINRKLWAQVGRELGCKGKITSSLSSSLKMLYHKILYPLELHLKDEAHRLVGDEKSGSYEMPVVPCLGSNSTLSAPGEPANVSPSTQTSLYGHSTNADLEDYISPDGTVTKRKPVGGPESTPDSANGSKRQKLNDSAPLILGSSAEFRRSVRLKAAKGFLLNDPHLVDLKSPLVISVQDETQDSEARQKSRTFISPIGASAQVNNYLRWLASLSPVFQDSTRLDVSSKMATTHSLRQFMEKDAKFQEFLMRNYPNVFSKVSRSTGRSDDKLWIEPRDMESIFWQYLADSPPEFSRLENCPKLPGYLAEGGINFVGSDFANRKDQVYAGSGAAEAARNASNYNSDTYDKSAGLQELSHDYFAHTPKMISGALNPFESSNVPILPDSLLGALSASDLAGSDLVIPRLNIGQTFSTENWRCEDHFTQLSSYHSFGKSRRWYFIPESEFKKFENLLEETVTRQNREQPRINKNYDMRCWNLDTFDAFATDDEEVISAQYEFLQNSLENIISPFPEIRMTNDNPIFAKLATSERGRLLKNQEYLITPAMLSKSGIKYTTTLQNQGELIYTYPKTYSATICLGFSVSEETNFASKLWLDYALEGEQWLKKQGILPNFSTFKLLVNFAQILESANGYNHHFNSDVLTKVSSNYTLMLESELALRSSVRQAIKAKEVTIEERNIADADTVADDDLSNAIPSKVVFHSKSTQSLFALSLRSFAERLAGKESSQVSEELTFEGFLKHPDFSFELQLFFSDERLKSFQRSLTGFSVDFEAWMSKYDAMVTTEEDMVLKNYKALLLDGQKICSALSGAQNTFETFCVGKPTESETLRQAKRVESFKQQVKNLQDFVEESFQVVEQCQAILSLKHQQRIRNGASDGNENAEVESPESLQLLVELANKIPNLNFSSPEFDLILEFKTEIHNFDKACRSLIEQGTATVAEMNDMINLGTSFGIEIPSLTFLIRLKRRLQWMDTHKIIVSGGDPFSGKKEIFSLPDLMKFRDTGLKVLAASDVPKLQVIDQFLRDGQAYDESMKSYLSKNRILNDVDLTVLESKLVDMEEKSKWNGKDRLFMELSTYQELVELRAEEKYITFLREFFLKTHSLHEARQTMVELASSPFQYHDEAVKEKVRQGEEWLNKLKKTLTPVKVLHRRGHTAPVAKNLCNAGLADKLKLLTDKCLVALSNETVDVFENSSPYLFVHDIQDEVNNSGPIRYCLCRDYEDGTMIECDVCHEWFHVTCVKSISEIGKDDDRYVCPCCSQLAAYQKTSFHPVYKDKVGDSTIIALLKEGQQLRVQPVAELKLLKDLCKIIEEARDILLRPATRSKIVSEGPLYIMFMLRKFIGSPVIVSSISEHLMGLLKAIDLSREFERKEKVVTEDVNSTENASENLGGEKSAINDAEERGTESNATVEGIKSTPEDRIAREDSRADSGPPGSLRSDSSLILEISAQASPAPEVSLEPHMTSTAIAGHGANAHVADDLNTQATSDKALQAPLYDDTEIHRVRNQESAVSVEASTAENKLAEVDQTVEETPIKDSKRSLNAGETAQNGTAPNQARDVSNLL